MTEELSKLLLSVTWFGMKSEATPKKTLLIDASLQRPRICRRVGSEGNPQGIGVEVAILHVLLKITLMVTKLHNFYSDLDRFLKN